MFSTLGRLLVFAAGTVSSAMMFASVAFAVNAAGGAAGGSNSSTTHHAAAGGSSLATSQWTLISVGIVVAAAGIVAAAMTVYRRTKEGGALHPEIARAREGRDMHQLMRPVTTVAPQAIGSRQTKTRRWRRLIAVLGTAAATTLAIAPAAPAANPAPRTGAHERGARPIVLPLLPGATGGGVIGGRGNRMLFGSVTMPDSSTRPTEWTRRDGKWAVTDLSSGGRLHGYATSEDRRGDVLVNDTPDSIAWVVTSTRTVHRLRDFGGPSSGVYAAQINARGQIAGAVYGPAPGNVLHGARWASYAAAPRHLRPLPFPNSADSAALGINDQGVAVGNSDNADGSDFAGGEWLPRSSHGFLLPGVRGAHHSFPWRINNHNLAVGEAGNADGSVDGAAVWVGRRLHFLGTAIPSDTSARLLGVSENGRAVGSSASANFSTYRAVYWRGLHHPLRVLAPLSGTWRTGQASANYLSENGLAGGVSTDRVGNDQPVVWPHADAESFLPRGTTR